MASGWGNLGTDPEARRRPATISTPYGSEPATTSARTNRLDAGAPHASAMNADAMAGGGATVLPGSPATPDMSRATPPSRHAITRAPEWSWTRIWLVCGVIGLLGLAILLLALLIGSRGQQPFVIDNPLGSTTEPLPGEDRAQPLSPPAEVLAPPRPQPAPAQQDRSAGTTNRHSDGKDERNSEGQNSKSSRSDKEGSSSSGTSPFEEGARIAEDVSRGWTQPWSGGWPGFPGPPR